jgi:hypothetical protein
MLNACSREAEFDVKPRGDLSIEALAKVGPVHHSSALRDDGGSFTRSCRVAKLYAAFPINAINHAGGRIGLPWVSVNAWIV